MGLNTSVIVMNDSLGSIESDPEFGRLLARAVKSLEGDTPAEVWSGNSLVGYVIETHHSSGVVPVLIGGNTGTPIRGIVLSGHPLGTPTTNYEEMLLRQLAHKHGYRLVRRKS